MAIIIPSDKILDWLVDNRILSIALEGNIDQAQYCDKIKNIMDFLGTRLSITELAMIWKMQVKRYVKMFYILHLSF